MIVLRSYGADSNPAGASAFVGIPKPVGVQDGDLLLVAIALPAAGLTVTPPSEDWQQIAQTDRTLAFGIVAFQKTALNEQDNWVFALSSSVLASGVVAVYGNADAFQPVEVFAADVTFSSASQAVGGVTVSLADEELVLFLAAAASGTFTPSAGYTFVARKQQAGSTVELQHQQKTSAGVVASTTETFTSAVSGASLLVVLRPSFGRLSNDDVRNRIVDGLPLDADKVYDLTPTGDYYKYFQAIAIAMRVFGHDMVDVLRNELIPHLTYYVLQQWEQVFGIENSRIAKLGTVPQRQAQILAAWRAAAGQGSSLDAIQGVVGPLLGYALPNKPQVVECDRAALQALHTYTGVVRTVTPSTIQTWQFDVLDGGKVSTGGVEITLAFAAPGPYDLEVQILAPDGTSAATWNLTTPSGDSSVKLFASGLIGKQIHGNWTLTVDNESVGSVAITPSMFAEGVQDHVAPPLQATGGAVFDWGVYADPAHVAEAGVPGDFASARAAVKKMAFAHTVANLLQSLIPYPDEDFGVNAAIPDECIPT